ncbi:MAG: glycosyltransferase family 9 protein, partial [Micromonosporaceae bacterium]|nr:glycosyltransferase family 9 protein [Micromonosporaceae bacterium]
RPPVVLALRALGLGDLLTAVPALRALRRGFPDAQIVLAAPATLAPLVARIGAVDRLLPVPSAVHAPPGPLPAAAQRPALAVNLHGRGPQSTAALRRLLPARLWSYGTPGGPPWRDDEHEVDRWCRLLAWYGCAVDRDDLYLDTGPTGADPKAGADPKVGTAGAPPRRGPVLVHPGASTVDRRWPADRFAAVARALAERGYPVRVTAGPAEQDLAARVTAAAGLPATAVAGSMSLDALTDLVASSRLVVCNDTGVAHLATACRTPSVVIFGPQPPSRWGPPANGRHRVLWSPDDARDADPRPRRIGTADVLAAAEELLAAS